MSFSIRNYDRTYLEGITALYNAETDFEPHIAPLTPERFIELVESKSYFDPEGLFVAMEKDKVVGWIHACVAPGSEDITGLRTESRASGCLFSPATGSRLGARWWLKLPHG